MEIGLFLPTWQLRRLRESGKKILEWLNVHPLVVPILDRDFPGRPISTANLSEWRAHGYALWLAERQGSG